jgi:hypothetical protein
VFVELGWQLVITAPFNGLVAGLTPLAVACGIICKVACNGGKTSKRPNAIQNKLRLSKC